MEDKKIIFGITLAFIFLASVGFSYAYFTSSIVNNEVKDQVVETGTLSLRYVDGPEIVMQNIKPGDTITKTVYVANTGTLDATYNLIWQELTNEITNDEMLIEGTCTRLNGTTEEVDGTCDGITSLVVSSNTIKSKITIEPSIVHKYDLTITFKEINNEQNYNQNKKFSGVLGIREYVNAFARDSWETIATNVINGDILDYNIGDTKEVDLGNLGKHNVRIANTSTPDECSTEGFSQTACGFVVEFEDIITTHAMNSTNTNTGGWPESEMYIYVNTNIYNMLPDDLKNVIMDTIVVSSRGLKDSSNFKSTDKLYLLSLKEIYKDYSDSIGSLTRQLDYYKNNNVTSSSCSDAKKYSINMSSWWLRSTEPNYSNLFYYVTSDGRPYSLGIASDTSGVSPAFRIG